METSQHSAELSTSAEMSMNAFLNDNKTVCYLPFRTLHCDHLLRRRSYPEQLAAVENSGVSVRNNSVLSVRHKGPLIINNGGCASPWNAVCLESRTFRNLFLP